MTSLLSGKTAVVTGASAGIGEATAETLAKRGANVAMIARRESKLQTIADRLEAETEGSALVLPADVSNEDEVQAAVEHTVEAFDEIDVLVNNAGMATGHETVEDTPTEQYRTVMGVNVDGVFFMTRAALPSLRETAGNAIFVGSFAGQYPRPGAPVYAASKWWVRGFALSLAGSVGSDGIGVSIVNPTEVRTEFGKEYRDEISQNRFDPDEVTNPETIAEAIAFAAEQEPPNVVNELDLYRRDKFASF
ncbi:SDR family oxidoreductase [Natronorubrum sp. DTA7]|uniref:SDR family oxidoreductase n=1 Tax=Natronorubrum sp. DTA7 TaxID=3447016 RepID=UPI003F84EE72